MAGLAAGASHTCALLSNGEARCWGANASGQLGNGTTAVIYPVSVAGIANGVEIVADTTGDSTCALLSDGTAKCWGVNGSSQLGDGSTTWSACTVYSFGGRRFSCHRHTTSMMHLSMCGR